MKIELCLGSSCYARGNREILDILEEYIKSQELEDKVSIKGAHCLGKCSKGPVIYFDEDIYTGLHPSCIIDILKYHMEK